VILDSDSRYVPGWMLARAERAQLAERLLADTITKQHISRDQLTSTPIGHLDGSTPVAFLLADLASPSATASPIAPTTIPTARPSSRP
jgi:putative transposase